MVEVENEPVHSDPLEFVVSAAEFRLEFERLSRARLRRVGRSEFTVFAVDSDIVKLFIDPSTVGPKGERPGDNGYGYIFPSDTEKTSTAVATILAEYLFGELSPDNGVPLFQFRPHEDETRGILDAISSKLARQPPLNKTPNEILQSEWKDLINSIIDADADKLDQLANFFEIYKVSDNTDFEEIAKYLLETVIFEQRKLDFQFVRFLKLFAERRLVPIDVFSKVMLADGADPRHAAAFAAPTEISEWVKISQKTDFWLEQLLDLKSRKTHKLSIERDATAMAYLEYYNQKLKLVNGRVVLITGDRSIREAAERSESDCLAGLIIHPKSFLIEALEKHSADTDHESHFVDSLDILLVKYTGAIGTSRRDLAALAARERGALRDLRSRLAFERAPHEDIYEIVERQWASIRDNIALSGMLSIDLVKDLIIEISGTFRELTKAQILEKLTSLDEKLEAATVEQWTDLGRSVSEAGLGLLYAIRRERGGESRSRNPPTIILDTYRATRLLISKVLSTDKIDDLDPSLPELINGISDDVQDHRDDPRYSDYLTFLAFSMLCAAEGRWYVARILAERATNVALSIEADFPGENEVTGRESFYLLSQATRVAARTSSDLEEAVSFLSKSDACLNKETSAGDPRRSAGMTALKSIRNRLEATAIEIAFAHFRCWCDDGDPKRADTRNIQEKLVGLAHQALSFESGDEGCSNYLAILGHYIFVNMVQTYHLSAALNCARKDGYREVMDQLFEAFISGAHGGAAAEFTEEVHDTYLMKVYREYFASCIRGRSISNKRSRSNLLSEKRIENNSILTYDSKRYLSLRKEIIG